MTGVNGASPKFERFDDDAEAARKQRGGRDPLAGLSHRRVVIYRGHVRGYVFPAQLKLERLETMTGFEIGKRQCPTP